MLKRVAIAMLLLTACKDDPGSSREIEEMKARKGKPQPAPVRENVKIITSPIPYGKKIPCAQLLDPVAISTAIGQPLEMKEVLGEDAEAAAVCAFHTTGKALSEKEQKKKFDTEGMKLGVLPGDELCRLTVYGWGAPQEVAMMKKECEERKNAYKMETTTEIGDLTCVQVFEAGADYKFVYRVSDSDTKAILQTNPGPSVNSPSDSVAEEKVVKACAKAFADAITPEKIKVIQ